MRLPSILAAFLLATAAGPFPSAAQPSSPSDIAQAIDRLGETGSVLMIAAHPDDEENTLLAYFARSRHLRTAYLSLNRGEGGQNLLGAEQGVEIGLLRTQELLAARRLDGASQFFTRSIDFGYSKTAGETYNKWGRERILADVVWVIRRFQPDIVVNIFRGSVEDGHGNHQASALLSLEAFRAAGDPRRFPEQLAFVKPWSPKRLFHSPRARPGAKEPDSPNSIRLETGAYLPELGVSPVELAGIARSQHRSQSMGEPQRRGSNPSFLTQLEGPPAKSDPFSGIDTSWKRVPGAESLDTLFARVRRDFNARHPERLLPILAQARSVLARLSDPISRRKLVDLEEAIALCAGVWSDAQASDWTIVPGRPFRISTVSLNRLEPARVSIRGIRIEGAIAKAADGLPDMLAFNRPREWSFQAVLPPGTPVSQPYWLVKPPTGSVYEIADPAQLGEPENRPVLEAVFSYEVDGAPFEVRRAVQHRYVDAMRGELVRPLVVAPPVGLQLSSEAMLFPTASPRPVEISVTANLAGSEGEVKLQLPTGWRASPPSLPFSFAAAGESATLRFTVTPPADRSRGVLRASATIGTRTYSFGQRTLDYPHIRPITWFPPPAAALVREDVRVAVQRIGYIMGAGDDLPSALRQLGLDVTLLDSPALATGDLSAYQAIVCGIRAFNTRADARAHLERLLAYVEAGGTLIVQYNLPQGRLNSVMPARFSPFPITLGLERVSVEEAPVQLLLPADPLLAQPNAILPTDFDGWVQERGLYFASEWDAAFAAPLAINDPGEKPLAGGVLWARYGKGVYVYTSLAWFRQLPAGVPGAFKLFANLLSAHAVLPAPAPAPPSSKQAGNR